MNHFVGWVSKQEQFIFKDIAFSFLYVLAFYLLLITLINLWKNKSHKSFKYLLISVLIIQVAVIFTKYDRSKNQFVIFHKSRFTLLGHVNSHGIQVHTDFDSLMFSKDKVITDFLVGNHIKSIENDTLKPLYIINNKSLLVIDNLGIYNIKSFNPDYVLLRQSPKINLNRLIDSIKPKHIIADGSNYKSYIEHWESTCKKRKLPFHQTSKKGAFIIDY
jgi:competence protein ComEC